VRHAGVTPSAMGIWCSPAENCPITERNSEGWLELQKLAEQAQELATT
jgi:hypothetical protein